ncbi:MAG: HAMP domain-containing protein [Lachnospiraceae bacterium]|nr:HAMP domain-containing protein [Lachnospiraceae bacterium]
MKKTLSLRVRMMLAFFAVAFVIILIFFLMNGVFWNFVYLRTNRNTLENVYEDVRTKVAAGNTTSEELKESVENVPTGAVIYFALQGDSDWEFNLITREIVSPAQQRFLRERLQENFLNKESEGVKVIKQSDAFTLQEVRIESDENLYYEMFGYMKDNRGTEKKFILSMPLEPMYRTLRLSNTFFVAIGISMMLLGLVLIMVISNRVSRPISELSDISNRMKNLDFSARYTGDQKDEIGILGNNMNEMASQLERTILKLKMANESLEKDLEEKEHVDEMRKDFISNVSHELKTPIALIQGYAEGLEDMKDDPESFRYYLDVIVDEAGKMDRMVKKLTTLNQLEFGTADFMPVVFDIVEMVRSVIAASKKQAEEKGVLMEADLPEKLTVFGDTFEIEEVLNNYFSNAFHHVKAPNRISVRAEDLGVTARVSVFNSGDPIPEEDIDKIWTKFYKVDKARTRSYGGSGIGLSIVKAIMEAHHMEYGVYNDADGVTFWFELARKEEE